MSVSASTYAGGLVGYFDSSSGGVVSLSYAAGQVSNASADLCGLVVNDIVNSSYYDSTLVATQTGTCSGTGEPTVNMQQQATYVGWDFVNIWTINEGADYPRLRWEP